MKGAPRIAVNWKICRDLFWETNKDANFPWRPTPSIMTCNMSRVASISTIVTSSQFDESNNSDMQELNPYHCARPMVCQHHTRLRKNEMRRMHLVSINCEMIGLNRSAIHKRQTECSRSLCVAICCSCKEGKRQLKEPVSTCLKRYSMPCSVECQSNGRTTPCHQRGKHADQQGALGGGAINTFRSKDVLTDKALIDQKFNWTELISIAASLIRALWVLIA